MNNQIKYTVDSETCEDTEIRVQDGGVVNIYHNGEHLISEYYQDRCLDEVVDWEKLSEGKKYLKDWEGQHDVTEEMIQDALNWLFISTEDFEFVKVETVKELFN